MNTDSRRNPRDAGRVTLGTMTILAGTAALLVAALSPAAPPRTSPNAAAPAKTATAPASKSGFTVDFDAATYRDKKFPGWCNIYVVFRNEKKKRPLFALGSGSGGALFCPFDTSGLVEKDEPDASTGEGKIKIEFYDPKRGTACFFRGEDWNTYTCGQWVQADPSPTLDITLSNVAEWKTADKLMRKFLNPDRRRPPPGTPDITPKFTTLADMNIRVGNNRAQLKAVPCKVTFAELEARAIWQVRFEIRTKVAGTELGLVGDDAGDISLFFVAIAYCDPPKGFKAPTLEGDTINMHGLSIPD